MNERSVMVGFKAFVDQSVFMDKLARKNETTVSQLVRDACIKVYGMPEDVGAGKYGEGMKR
ncbi:hypothetical protein CCP3SC15_380021 [Gammaproteobacteria bacterium]